MIDRKDCLTCRWARPRKTGVPGAFWLCMFPKIPAALRHRCATVVVHEDEVFGINLDRRHTWWHEGPNITQDGCPCWEGKE